MDEKNPFHVDPDEENGLREIARKRIHVIGAADDREFNLAQAERAAKARHERIEFWKSVQIKVAVALGVIALGTALWQGFLYVATAVVAGGGQ